MNKEERAALGLKVRGVASWLAAQHAEAPYIVTSAVETLLLAADELFQPSAPSSEQAGSVLPILQTREGERLRTIRSIATAYSSAHPQFARIDELCQTETDAEIHSSSKGERMSNAVIAQAPAAPDEKV